MPGIIVQCPHCQARLRVKDQHVGTFVLCGKCSKKFRIRNQPEPVMEDVVASWLTDGADDDGEAVGADIDEQELLAQQEQPGPDAQPAPARGAPAIETSTAEGVRILRVESRGVLFEFPARCLRDETFRSAFPRQCISCDARTHLAAHVVIFSPDLKDSVSVEAEHNAGTLRLSDDEVRGLSDTALLERLPSVPNVPSPGDLPMPYWVCDMCSGSGMVYGQIHVNETSGKGRCRLFIANIHRALEFADAAGGESVENYARLKQRVEQTEEDPWQTLPEVVQHRVEQWFHPNEDESFLGFVPDRDHARTEDGVAGLLVSTRRIIYHSPRRHRESGIDQPIELEHQSAGGKQSISIVTPGWEIKHMTVDREGSRRLRRALSSAKFQAVWR